VAEPEPEDSKQKIRRDYGRDFGIGFGLAIGLNLVAILGFKGWNLLHHESGGGIAFTVAFVQCLYLVPLIIWSLIRERPGRALGLILGIPVSFMVLMSQCNRF
jgi:tetrahydromethanopterin S-methyltransferase subunit G